MKGVSVQRSELLQEIVSTDPGFLIRWGNTVFLGLIILLGFLAWFISYPEIIRTTAKLSSIDGPKPIISVIDSRLKRFDVLEGQLVDKGAILGYLESTADASDILDLELDIDAIQSLLDEDAVERLDPIPFNRLGLFGELQGAYQVFSTSYLSFSNYISQGTFQKKMEVLRRDEVNLREYSRNLIEQKELYAQDLAISTQTFLANEKLSKQEVISTFDFRVEQSKLIAKQLALPQIDAAIINNDVQQADKEKELIELAGTMNQQKIVFQQSLNTLKSQIVEWKRKYLLISPTKGRVAFVSFMQGNQQISMNQTICYINPEESEYFAEVIIPQANFGKVSVNQKVLLKFDSYPFQEYGIILGNIDFISSIPNANGYLARVVFPDGLITTHRHVIQFRNGLSANAEIVTKDIRLLERLYFTFMRQITR